MAWNQNGQRFSSSWNFRGLCWWTPQPLGSGPKSTKSEEFKITYFQVVLYHPEKGILNSGNDCLFNQL